MLRNDTTIQVAARYQTRVINRSQLERTRAGAILPWSDCASESADEGERQPHVASPERFDRPTDAVREHGTAGEVPFVSAWQSRNAMNSIDYIGFLIVIVLIVWLLVKTY